MDEYVLMYAQKKIETRIFNDHFFQKSTVNYCTVIFFFYMGTAVVPSLQVAMYPYNFFYDKGTGKVSKTCVFERIGQIDCT